MKVFLIGDFSGVHYNLKIGLQEINIDAVLASTGDGWKKIPHDVVLPSPKSSKLTHQISFRIRLFIFFLRIRGFDVVQIMNPDILPTSFFPVWISLHVLRIRNKKLFLLASGSDAMFVTHADKRLRYTPLGDHKKYDLKSKCHPRDNRKSLSHVSKIANLCDGIIPILYEYSVVYEDFPNLKEVIPLPIDTYAICPAPIETIKNIRVFHGRNSRPGFKGTHYVEEVFEKLKDIYPYVDFVIAGPMPLSDYLLELQKSTIVIDQINSYSTGMNAIYALAMGKIVIGGSEPEAVTAFGERLSPVINVTPGTSSLVAALHALLSYNEAQLQELSKLSREYCEEIHNCVSIAKQYSATWAENGG